MDDRERPRFRDALGSRDFRVLVGAFVVDQIGTWAYNVVLLVYVFERTHSPGAMALASACRWLPGLVLGPHAGVLGDRFDRVRVMRASALLSGAAMLGVAALVAVDGPVPVLLVLAAVSSALTQPYAPAAGALRADVVPEKDLAAANALFATLDSLVLVLGPLLGAGLLAVGSRAVPFLVNAASFLVAAVLVSRIGTRTGPAEPATVSFTAQLLRGVRTLRDEPIALTLTLFVALDSAVYGASTVLYVPLSRHVGQGTGGYGVLLTCFAVGGVVAGGAANRLSALPRLAPVVLGGMLLLGLPYAACALTASPVVVGVLQALAGAGMITIDVLGLTALQRDLPREVLSRVLGVLGTLALGGMLVGSVVVVPLLHGPGLATTLAVVGLVVSGVSVLGVRPLLRADRRGAAVHALLAPRVALLEALDLLAGAPRATLEQLAMAVQVVELDEGATVMRQGEPADALWVVVSGAVAVTTQDGKGRERLRSGLGAHSYVGEIGLLRGIARTATVRTTATSTLWRIPAPDFRAALSGGTASPSLQAVSQARYQQLQRRSVAGPTPRTPRKAQGPLMTGPAGAVGGDPP